MIREVIGNPTANFDMSNNKEPNQFRLNISSYLYVFYCNTEIVLSIVPYYAALLALLFTTLPVNVIRGRRSGKLALGIGSDAALERRVRVHANFAEYVPSALLLIAMVEISEALGILIHLLCASLLTGRAAHAWGVSRAPKDFRFRVGGTAATLTSLIVAALLLLVG